MMGFAAQDIKDRGKYMCRIHQSTYNTIVNVFIHHRLGLIENPLLL